MRFVKATRLSKISAPVSVEQGDLWYCTDANQKTLAFRDTDDVTQYVLTKSLLASQVENEGAALVGVEQVLSTVAGGNLQQVLEDIDAKISALESGLEWEPQVLNFADAADLLTPNAGDRYLVGPSAPAAGDAFEGHLHSIATWDGSTWIFEDLTDVNEGTAVFVQELNKSYIFSSVVTGWVTLSSTMLHNALGSIQGGVVGEYYHLTDAYHTLVNALDKVGAGQGSTVIKVEDAALLGSFTGKGAAGSLTAVLESLAKVSSDSASEGASLIKSEAGSLTALLTGTTDVQGALEVVDSLGTTNNGAGASLIKIEDAAANYTADDVEGVFAEVATTLNNKATIARSSALVIADVATTNTATFVHNLNNNQLIFSVQVDDGSGNAEEYVDALVDPTPGNEANSLTITVDENGTYYLTVMG